MEASGEDRLERYRDKRRFTRTPEPPGEAAAPPAEAGGSSFVVQKHLARRLHYDFRLEAGGVLVSWAVPKGPSYDPGAKRLAVHVEDHPLDYRDFEGVIPGGEYGAGKVIVWDRGTYTNVTHRDGRPVPLEEAVERGHVSVQLEGAKLRGGWSLTRTGRPAAGERESWILVKRADETAEPGRDVTAEQPDSVLGGGGVEDVGAGEGDERTWSAGRATWTPPMLAQLVRVADHAGSARTGEWVYERKLDGLRTVAVRNGSKVELWSRNHLSFTERFPGVVRALAALPADTFTLDGEVVAFEGDRTSFARLQRPEAGDEPVYCVFDLLALLGHDTTELPLDDRRRLLQQAVGDPGGALRVVERLEGDPATLLRRACDAGWEGLIAKREGSAYRAGRSPDWQKLKCSASQELVVGGWTDPSGARTGFGALLVGYYEGDALRYAGKVGTGFTDRELRELHSRLEGLAQPESPFAERVRVKGAHWARPELVASVSFTEWTTDGRLRHPRYDGLRPDKRPAEVRRERPA